MAIKKTPHQHVDLILLHGLAGSPDRNWLPWLHRQAEDAGARVWAPELPEPLKPELTKWLKATTAKAKEWGPETVIIGHSLGGVLALRLVEATCQKKIRAVILVGTPFAASVNVSWLTGFFSQTIDWGKIRQNAGEFVVIQAKNDPLVPFDHAFRYQEMLGAKTFVTERDGHFTGRNSPLIWQEVSRLLTR
ncbi:MAG: alpha/beta fold hydrolase [Patescibacteria group bacterium]|nr:alpha/beta fold hydrolase [Patescibacteria group bacterium]